MTKPALIRQPSENAGIENQIISDEEVEPEPVKKVTKAAKRNLPGRPSIPRATKKSKI